MSRERLAQAFDKAAEAMVELALELRANDSAPVRADAPGAGGVPPAPAPAASLGVDTSRCPKHHTPWEQGQYGPYCKQMTDDPAWGKAKTDRDGNPVLWCKLTPKNAPDWVKVNGLPAA